MSHSDRHGRINKRQSEECEHEFGIEIISFIKLSKSPRPSKSPRLTVVHTCNLVALSLSSRHERRKRQSASEKGQISTRYTSCICQLGDSLVFIFPLAPMLTFTSAVGKLNVRVLWHHHMLLQVISQSYCQVFVKSYNFVFEKIDKEGSPREK